MFLLSAKFSEDGSDKLNSVNKKNKHPVLRDQLDELQYKHLPIDLNGIYEHYARQKHSDLLRYGDSQPIRHNNITTIICAIFLACGIIMLTLAIYFYCMSSKGAIRRLSLKNITYPHRGFDSTSLRTPLHVFRQSTGFTRFENARNVTSRINLERNGDFGSEPILSASALAAQHPSDQSGDNRTAVSRDGPTHHNDIATFSGAAHETCGSNGSTHASWVLSDEEKHRRYI
ncbi:hypothetical protein BIW11_13240 [Tropilaelaps mercedesae]|uniref:Uncharacterized protein n=1 Tax=Tropilaelaps mercedesae TaxID=418985 RepID=A0A1V9X3Q3_9ACAR|nr:hypothetical protein BIW11_13240 [Tropilaelaps mercedesae]